jgi:lipopolysaccharide/colanic/teichoic acid biosynthesis glycosyltransferase
LVRRIPGVLTTTEFEQVFLRERARVDRTARCFSLLVLDCVEQDRDELERLAALVLERTRAADILGWMDSHRLGSILPDTPGSGAWTLADDLIRRLAKAGFRVDFEVFTYPVRPKAAPPADDGASHNGEHGRDGRGRNGELEPPRRGAGDRAARRRGDDPAAITEDLEAIRQQIGPRPVTALEGFEIVPLPRWKRALDVAGSSALLLVLSPVFALAALAIKLTSPGPVIFRQIRAGLGGRPFVMYKFRSMTDRAEAVKQELLPFSDSDGPAFKMRNDPRITPVGRLLRKTSIDELPQLWNVLKGDMTLVGPRPPTPDEVAHYQPWQRRRLLLTGGLTCIWQVSGRSEVGFDDWVRMDLRYSERRSLLLDLELVAKTARAVLSGRGAY